jgi:hypothetical protein
MGQILTALFSVLRWVKHVILGNRRQSQMAINQYFDVQKENLRRSLNWEPFAAIFPLVDKLYVDAIG